MFTESQTMKDLHKIREDLYNETRFMKQEERIAYLNDEAGKIRYLIRPSASIEPMRRDQRIDK